MRRRVFLLGAAALPAAACGGPVSLPVPDLDADLGGCRTPDSLASFSTLGGAPLRYEITGSPQSFRADPRFIDLLEEWVADWVAVSGLGPLTRVSTYGAFVDKCDSWHAAGRAFDFAELVHEGGSVSCRYDVWGEDPAQLPGYWRLAASVAARFTYTLTYRYNAQHHNHIHVDNGVNGYERASFRERSGAQVDLVQGVLRHVFGRNVEASGSYDEQTKSAVRAVQRELGIGVPLADPDGWREFLTGAAGQR
ncbi:extensin family protein [Tessaracoccus sp. Z1128]